MLPNERQVGGEHYGIGEIQHWDFAWTWRYNSFEYPISKYICRHQLKNGLQDVEKAEHYFDKYIELVGPVHMTLNNRRVIEHPIKWCESLKLGIMETSIIMVLHVGQIELARGLTQDLIRKLKNEGAATPGYVDQNGSKP